jgi:DNA-binding CsgD family transcriptional regulator
MIERWPETLRNENTLPIDRLLRVFYSIGVASFVYALLLLLTKREPLLGRFIACSAVMTFVVAASVALNALGDGMAQTLRDVLRWLNLSGAAAIVYLLVAFTVDAFPFAEGRLVKRLALGLSAAGLALCAADSAFRPGDWIKIAVLSLKTIAIYGAAAIALVPRRGAAGSAEPRRMPSQGPYQGSLRSSLIAGALLGPFILWEEAGTGPLAFPLKISGSLSLPLLYGIWSVSFIIAQLRVKPAPGMTPSAPDEAFIARFGITPREGELLGLLLTGRSYKDIMAALSISMPTVKSHVASIYRKTGVANRLELARMAASQASEGRPPLRTKG